MADESVLQRIQDLVTREKELRDQHAGDGLDAMGQKRLQALEVELDQCWDYLRQRRAAREFGLGDQAAVRSADVVERYQQ